MLVGAQFRDLYEIISKATALKCLSDRAGPRSGEGFLCEVLGGNCGQNYGSRLGWIRAMMSQCVYHQLDSIRHPWLVLVLVRFG